MSVVNDFYQARATNTSWARRQRSAWLQKLRASTKVSSHEHHDRLAADRDVLADAVIVTNDAIQRATNQIAQIEEHVVLGGDVRNRLLTCLRASLSADSVFPTVTSDGDDGLIAQWRAGERFLAVEMTSDGDYSLMLVDSDGVLRRNESASGYPDLDNLKALVRDFTAAVVARNPRWRDLFE
ncbi:hypothetical protein [Curtobacterium aetherium]|uniref:Uncharacterized protein n=1 Tax=Curtobacterium aetherium TaxID=2841594 RepID=A0ACD1E2M1_9MICO|nr:hypothetical protein [Curtobacterium sp. L6-1]QWS33053.1 hypothetical protein KM842_12435 [Curtobacterium sp. L6-1]